MACYGLPMLWAQDSPAQPAPTSYLLAGLTISGHQYSHASAIKSISGLNEGEVITIPGFQVSEALKRLWKEQLYADLAVHTDSIKGEKIWLRIEVTELPRLSEVRFEGVKKSQLETLKERLNLRSGILFTEAKRQSTARMVRNFYVEKGFYEVAVNIETSLDPMLRRGQQVLIKVDKGKKSRLTDIQWEGASAFSEGKLNRQLRALKPHAWYKFWQSGKYTRLKQQEAERNLLAFYQRNGYRDARVVRDTLFFSEPGKLRLQWKISEGQPYYHRGIRFVGNMKYDEASLKKLLGIQKGDLYSAEKLEERLFASPTGTDISALYLDQGYLFFSANPVEVAVVGDSIDVEIRMYEGGPARIRKVEVVGNDKTSDDVINRELSTLPGDVFSRAAIIRSQRSLMSLGYFEGQTMNVVPTPDAENGTVDLRYELKEQMTDKFQLSGGWSPYVRDDNDNIIGGGFSGTAQINFNNFSTKRLFNRKSWTPVPMGDGQKMNLAFQAVGSQSKTISFSFLEPWMGGKRPNFLGFNTAYSSYRYLETDSLDNLSSEFSSRTFSASIDYGRRLRFPDRYFRYDVSLGYKYYDLKNPGIFYPVFEEDTEAVLHAITLRQQLSRNNLDDPNFPTTGSINTFSVEVTPPYVALGIGDGGAATTPAEKYKLMEFHKWKLNSSWFFNPVGKAVLHLHGEAGYVGGYGQDAPPFERFMLGGSGMQTGFSGLMGTEVVPLRGYTEQVFDNDQNFYPAYHRYAIELRHPIPHAPFPAWVLGFAEAGAGYESVKDLRFTGLKRSAGLGIRANVPMLGILGLDWGYGFDNDPETGKVSGSHFHLSFGTRF